MGTEHRERINLTSNQGYFFYILHYNNQLLTVFVERVPVGINHITLMLIFVA